MQMPAGQIHRAFAFELSPQQHAPFGGGQLPTSASVQAALDTTFDASKLVAAPAVTFEIDSSDPTRAHAIRDAAKVIAFGQAAKALVAAEAMTERLALAMDHRSNPCLLMITVHQADNASKQRIVFWTFPQQEVFRLDTTAGKPTLDLLDAFSRDSRLRKAALLEGGNGKSDLLTARVLDFQASATDNSVADLWIVKFLRAKMQMSSQEGTGILARALRHAHDRTRGDVNAQAQIHAAITGIRTSQQTRMSIDQVATQYFTPELAAVFVAPMRSEERQAAFVLDVARFDQLVQYRIFELENGVLVSAPFSEVGSDSVQIKVSDGQRTLVAQGVIESEKVRARAN